MSGSLCCVGLFLGGLFCFGVLWGSGKRGKKRGGGGGPGMWGKVGKIGPNRWGGGNPTRGPGNKKNKKDGKGAQPPPPPPWIKFFFARDVGELRGGTECFLPPGPGPAPKIFGIFPNPTPGGSWGCGGTKFFLPGAGLGFPPPFGRGGGGGGKRGGPDHEKKEWGNNPPHLRTPRFGYPLFF